MELTREEFKRDQDRQDERIASIEVKIDKILGTVGDIHTEMSDLKHNIELNQVLFTTESDKRFIKKEALAVEVHSITEEFFSTPKGRNCFKNAYDELACNQRDKFVKWVTFGKSVLWLVSTVIVVYVFRSLQTLTAVTDNIMQMVK